MKEQFAQKVNRLRIGVYGKRVKLKNHYLHIMQFGR